MPMTKKVPKTPNIKSDKRLPARAEDAVLFPPEGAGYRVHQSPSVYMIPRAFWCNLQLTHSIGPQGGGDTFILARLTNCTLSSVNAIWRNLQYLLKILHVTAPLCQTILAPRQPQIRSQQRAVHRTKQFRHR